MRVICEYCLAVLSATTSFDSVRRTNIVQASNGCNCGNIPAVKAVIWSSDGYRRPFVREATGEEVEAWDTAVSQRLRDSHEARQAEALPSAVAALERLLAERFPATLDFFRGKTRRQGPTHRKRLTKAANEVSGEHSPVGMQELQKAFEKAIGYR